MKHYVINSVFILISFCLGCQSKPDVNEIYRHVIQELVTNYNNSGRPHSELDRVVIDEVPFSDNDNFIKYNSKYKVYKISFDEIQNLRISDRFEFTERTRTKIIISNELFYTNDGHYILNYAIDFGAKKLLNQIHFNKVKGKYYLIENKEEKIILE